MPPPPLALKLAGAKFLLRCAAAVAVLVAHSTGALTI